MPSTGTCTARAVATATACVASTFFTRARLPMNLIKCLRVEGACAGVVIGVAGVLGVLGVGAEGGVEVPDTASVSISYNGLPTNTCMGID